MGEVQAQAARSVNGRPPGRNPPMLILWGRINSLNVQKVVFALEECGVAYERREAGMAFGVVNTPEYRAKNPNGLVPLLEDGDAAIWESNAIIRYLAAKYAACTLWAEDPAERSLADRWMDWLATALNPAFSPAFYHLYRIAPEKRDPAAIAASVAATEPMMAILDSHLDRNAFLAGARFTMAETALGPAVHRWLHLPVERKSRPNVERWYRAIAVRPAAGPALPLPLS
jgi:glutathione S-transferase